MAGKNVCKQGLGYTIRHRDAAAQHVKLRKSIAADRAQREAEEAFELEVITALLRKHRIEAQG